MQIKEVLKSAILLLKQNHIDTPELDARILLEYAANISKETIFFNSDIEISTKRIEAYKKLIDRRIKNEPVAKIIGKKAFWKSDFFVNTNTLDPRPDSEIIIETALKIFPDKYLPLKFLDLGVGSGCLILSLLHEFPNSTGIAIDLSSQAIEIAKQNAIALGLENRVSFLQSNWADALIHPSSPVEPFHYSSSLTNAPPSSLYLAERSADQGSHEEASISNRNNREKFDLIVSNPPYIPSEDIHNLSIDVKNYDPIIALDGGQDGLNPYHYLAKQISYLLKPNACAILEFGYDQGEKVKEIFTNNNYYVNEMLFDLSSKQRAIRVSI